MRLALPTTTLALAIALAAPVHAQGGSLRNGSEASKQVIVSVGAIGESGVKASTGLVAIPMGGIALASGAVGHVANASGYTEVGTTFSDGAAGATKVVKPDDIATGVATLGRVLRGHLDGTREDAP